MGKKSFISYLKSVSAENSGKPSAYAKAMEVIEETFFSKALADTTDVWNFISLENIDAIYEVVVSEQKKENGIFKDCKSPSYWKDGFCSAALKEYKHYLEKSRRSNQPSNQITQTALIPTDSTFLPKPFLLLAGISGTGKTRFVREQADASAAVERYRVKKDDNYCLVPVRPDWHEPSDLLGYISRIGGDGPCYVTTDLLHFIIAAWRHAVTSASADGIVYKAVDTMCPFWLCLDEMNLAPVEQYFADYLSILETRKWEDGDYSCDPLLKSAVIQQLGESGRKDFWEKLNMAGDDPLSSGLRNYFSIRGIPLPPNLIVAGTVNMDETTHGFSRKVIDRALTIDFGEFFRNDYGQFFTPENRPKTLGFPVLSQITRNDLSGVAADSDGQGTIGLLEAVNGILKDTPFELAYRALNEALLSVVCFNPSDTKQLQAVWDDFLMMKVLPRIEGDADKLYYVDEVSLLTRLSDILQGKLSDIWDAGRPDLFSEKAADGSPVMTFCRSKKKLAWMQDRLAVNAFTTFWP